MFSWREGTPLGETTVTVDHCRAVIGYAPPARPTGPTMVRSPAIDTVTAGPVLGEAPKPSTVPGDRTVATAGVAEGNPTMTVRPCKRRHRLYRPGHDERGRTWVPFLY